MLSVSVGSKDGAHGREPREPFHSPSGRVIAFAEAKLPRASPGLEPHVLNAVVLGPGAT